MRRKALGHSTCWCYSNASHVHLESSYSLFQEAFSDLPHLARLGPCCAPTGPGGFSTPHVHVCRPCRTVSFLRARTWSDAQRRYQEMCESQKRTNALQTAGPHIAPTLDTLSSLNISVWEWGGLQLTPEGREQERWQRALSFMSSARVLVEFQAFSCHQRCNFCSDP